MHDSVNKISKYLVCYSMMSPKGKQKAKKPGACNGETAAFLGGVAKKEPTKKVTPG